MCRHQTSFRKSDGKKCVGDLGSAPDPIGELTALPIHIAGLKGRGSERTRRRRRGGKGKKRRGGTTGRVGDVRPRPQIQLLDLPVCQPHLQTVAALH